MRWPKSAVRRTEFDAALKQAQEGLDAGMPEAANQRLRARLQGGPPRRRRLRLDRVGAAGSVVAALIIAVLLVRSPAPMASLGGFAVAEPTADFTATTTPQGDQMVGGAAPQVTIVSGSCTLRDQALGSTMRNSGSLSLRRLSNGVEVMAGTVELNVEHGWPRPQPFQVRVSHGEIEVLGTVFTVIQKENGGQVSLHRGSIRFRSLDGQVRQLRPGQSLSWPLPPEDSSGKVPPSPVQPQPTQRPLRQGSTTLAKGEQPAPAPAPEPVPTKVEVAPNAEDLLHRIAVLRSRGQFEEAADVLSEALKERRGTPTEERLSFELGTILWRHLRDPARACPHWRQHEQAFPMGRYESEVLRARLELQCP